jgi:aminomethyltransferase
MEKSYHFLEVWGYRMNRNELCDKHIKLGAKMINFNGWYMPVLYSGIIDEHSTVRSRSGLFDISHMGRIEISGGGAYDFLQYMVTFDISRLALGEAHYSLLCYSDGTIIDDVFIYRFEKHYWVVVNAANLNKDLHWLLLHAKSFDVKIRNISHESYMLALQGPNAEKILQKLFDFDLSRLRHHHFREGKALDIPATVARTGYTGEDGFELFIAIIDAEKTWDLLIEAGDEYGIKPIGLGARDTLRFEAGYPLYGNELNQRTNPFEARLGWVVNLEKRNFIGKDSLIKIRLEGIHRKLVGFEVYGGSIARHGFQIWVKDGYYGQVTSGSFAPTLKKSLGLGFVPREYAILGTELGIQIRNKVVGAVIVKLPFYDSKRKG